LALVAAIALSIFAHERASSWAVVLDGGYRGGVCMAVALGFWAVAAVIFIRRGTRLTWGDLVFVALGYPVMLVTYWYLFSRDGLVPDALPRLWSRFVNTFR
jgi:hypothetical protein